MMSFPILNVSVVPSERDTGRLSASDGRSIVVKTVPQAEHFRRRHVEGSFLWGLELVTLVEL